MIKWLTIIEISHQNQFFVIFVCKLTGSHNCSLAYWFIVKVFLQSAQLYMMICRSLQGHYEWCYIITYQSLSSIINLIFLLYILVFLNTFLYSFQHYTILEGRKKRVNLWIVKALKSLFDTFYAHLMLIILLPSLIKTCRNHERRTLYMWQSMV